MHAKFLVIRLFVLKVAAKQKHGNCIAYAFLMRQSVHIMPLSVGVHESRDQ